MTVTNKWLLISESRSDSNRCTPCRGKPDQHDTYASHASPRTPGVRFLRAVPVCGNLSRVIDRFEQIHCPWEGLPTQSTSLSVPWGPDTPAYKLQVKTTAPASRLRAALRPPRVPAAQAPAPGSGQLRGRHVSPRLGLPPLARDSSGATTCPCGSGSRSRLGAAPEPPCVLMALRSAGK
jgi:hypothetical protein